MSVIIACAGIPSEIFAHVAEDQFTIVRENAEFFGIELSGALVYTPRYVAQYEEHFAQAIRNDSQNKLETVSFGVLCINYGASVALFRELSPSFLVHFVEWTPELHGPPAAKRRSANELVRALAQAALQMKAALTALRTEILEQSNRTPLLLPVKNFKSGALETCLRRLEEDLQGSENCARTIREHVLEFQRTHPVAREEDGRRLSFHVDDRNVKFRAPGRDMHGRPPSGMHPNKCYLSGRRRLGVPYKLGFHFDCTKGHGNWRARLFGCHEPEREMHVNVHINIAPNDYLRD